MTSKPLSSLAPALRRYVVAAALLAMTGCDPLARSDCAALADLAIKDTNLLSATEVPAIGDLPAHCRVLGYVRPAIYFEVRLPEHDWNSKFYMVGCGGFCGTVDSDPPGFTNAMNYGLRRNYAVSTMDSGHWGSGSVDGRWAWNNRQAEVDWGQRAVTETARVTKSLINVYYGRKPAKSYFAGCSTGGRMAAMEASHYPGDFDGIIAGAPALDYTGLVATSFAWLVQANTGPDGKEVFARGNAELVRRAVYDACDANDGLKDNLIDDPRNCDFKPAALKCGGAPRNDCLTAAEVGVLEKWYAGPSDANGKHLYPGGIPLGSEPYWPLWLSGKPGDAMPGLITLFGQDFLRYMAFEKDPGEQYTAAQFDFERDPPRLARMAAIYNSDSPDLRAFHARGGRMIVYQGWADPVVTPYKTIDYVTQVEATMGGREKTQQFLRLFMVPGFGHCGTQQESEDGEPGFDVLTALDDWVEKGRAPDAITMTQRNGNPKWTRPLCPHPQVAQRIANGKANDEERFECVAP